jgi:hypothetical protein
VQLALHDVVQARSAFVALRDPPRQQQCRTVAEQVRGVSVLLGGRLVLHASWVLFDPARVVTLERRGALRGQMAKRPHHTRRAPVEVE